MGGRDSRATAATVRVLFVCMGNICRSPTAEGVLRQRLAARRLASLVEVDSAGTHAYHVGHPPDPRSCAAAARRGMDLTSLRARQVQAADFERFDYILAMDRDNLARLTRMQRPGCRARLGLLLQYAGAGAPAEVPDPYYGGADGFEEVLDLIERACDGLLEQLGY